MTKIKRMAQIIAGTGCFFRHACPCLRRGRLRSGIQTWLFKKNWIPVADPVSAGIKSRMTSVDTKNYPTAELFR